jgi:hypothetical protein
LRGVSKDGRLLVAHPSMLAVKNGEHLRMTAVFCAQEKSPAGVPARAFLLVKSDTRLGRMKRCPRQFNARPLPLVPEWRLMDR